MRIATYILIYLPIYSCLLVEYSTEKCLFLGVSKCEKGVGYVDSKSKGRGHDNFFLGNPPVFSFATVRKYPESAPGDNISLPILLCRMTYVVTCTTPFSIRNHFICNLVLDSLNFKKLPQLNEKM